MDGKMALSLESHRNWCLGAWSLAGTWSWDVMEFVECRSFTPGIPSKCVRFFTFTAVVQGSIWTFWNLGLHGLERQSAIVAVPTGTSLVNDAISTSTSVIFSNSLQPLPLEDLSSHDCDLEVQSLACFSHMTLGPVKIDGNFTFLEGVWNIALAFQRQPMNKLDYSLYAVSNPTILFNLSGLVA